MKKILFAVFAVVTVSFASCRNQVKSVVTNDSTTVDSVKVDSANVDSLKTDSAAVK